MQKHLLLFSFLVLCMITGVRAADNPPPASLSGIYTVGSSQPVYKKLTDVAAALNNTGNTVTGNVIFELDSDYDGTTGETFPITFKQFNSSGNWTVTIRPKAGVSMRTLSAKPTRSSDGLIVLDGADRLILDGRAGGSGPANWLIRNLWAGSSYPRTIYLQNDAQYNVLTYLQIEAEGQGAIYMGGTNKTNGNDFNTISYCTIGSRTDAGITAPLEVGIYSVGNPSDTARLNSDNAFLYNNLTNIYSPAGGGLAYGIGMYYTTRSLVSHNSFYHTQPVSMPTGTGIYAFFIDEAQATRTVFSDNFVGGSAPECGGSPFTLSGPLIRFTAFRVTSIGAGTNTGNAIRNNTIRNLNFTLSTASSPTTSFRFIEVIDGTIDVVNNTLGNPEVNDAIKFNVTGGTASLNMIGINVTSTKGGSITGNKIGGITTTMASSVTATGSFYAISGFFDLASPGVYNINDNVIGSKTLSNSIRMVSANAPFTFLGIFTGIGNATTVNYRRNTIAGIQQGYSGSAAWHTTAGILVDGSSVMVIDSNYVADITSNALIGTFNGIAFSPSSPTPTTNSIVSNNTVKGLRLTNSGAPSYDLELNGIYFEERGSDNRVFNNKIYDLTSANAPAESATGVTGITLDAPGKAYNNMISLENGVNTNNCRVTGIALDWDSDGAGIYHNSIYIGGNNGAGSNTGFSAAISSDGSALNLRNNLLVNARTGGSGAHFIFNNLSPSSNWSTTSSDYNVLVSADATKIGLWGSSPQNATQWKTTGGDIHSSFLTTAQIAPASLFNNLSAGDLSVPPGAHSYVGGKGTAGTGITIDYTGQPRSATTPTAGAWENSYIPQTNTAPPVITSDGGVPNVNLVLPENTITVTTVIATDADPGTTITYSIVDTLDGARFIIDPATGVLKFAPAPDFENPADDDANNIYFVIVQASDGELSTNQRFKIKITNTNDVPPVITSYSGAAGVNVTMAENTVAVGTVTATDVDPGTTITYSLENAEDAAKFSVNSMTGELVFLAAPDYEQPGDVNGDNIYMVTVIASDGDSVVTQRFKVKVTNVNDNAPVITSYSGADTVQLQSPENGQPVIVVTATDADAGTTITYSLVAGDDAALFSLNSSTGELAFITAPDFEQPADANGDNVYVVKVKASDGSLSDTQQYRIRVLDLNDNPPVVTMAIGIPENTVQVTTLEGTDADAGTIITFSVQAQDDGALFWINPATGALEFVTAPDFETPADANSDNEYVVSVKMFDSTTATILRFRVRVADVDGMAARSANTTGRVSVVADAAVEETVVRGGIKVYPNPVTNKRFTLRMDSIAAGRYTLELYGATGQLVYRQPLDHAGMNGLYPVQLPASLTRGIYTLVMKGAKTEFTGKLLVE